METPQLIEREEHFLIPGPRADLRLFLRFLPSERPFDTGRRAVLLYHRTVKMNTQRMRICVYFLSAMVNAKIALYDLQGTEFGGGAVTQTLLILSVIGSAGFLLPIAMLLFRGRLSEFMAIASAILCFPLCIYLILPDVFQRMLPWQYSVRTEAWFTWNAWAVFAASCLLLSVALAARDIYMPEFPRRPE